MAINKKLIHFKELEKFDEALSTEQIKDTSIVFIKDTKKIHTHDTTYKTVTWNKLDSYIEKATNGYEYVDMGDAGIWAKYNIGSTSNEGIDNCGDKFSIEDLENDVVKTNMGGNWRIPSKEDFEKLIELCDITLTGGYSLGYMYLTFTLKDNDSKKVIFSSTTMEYNDTYDEYYIYLLTSDRYYFYLAFETREGDYNVNAKDRIYFWNINNNSEKYCVRAFIPKL